MAMDNVGKALVAAGGTWRDVVQVHSSHVPSSAHGSVEEEASLLARLLCAFMPDHAPLWTCIGVPALGESSMRVAIRVVAYLPA
jgi:enamine deaminase RidA (YjgF/YER057c/UK114 family)